MLNTSYALVNHEQIVMQNNKKKSTLHLKKHVNYIFFKFVLPGSRVNSLLGGRVYLPVNKYTIKVPRSEFMESFTNSRWRFYELCNSMLIYFRAKEIGFSFSPSFFANYYIIDKYLSDTY